MVGEYGVAAIIIASRHSCCTIGRGFKERMPELRIEKWRVYSDDCSAVAVRTTCFGLAIWGMWQMQEVTHLITEPCFGLPIWGMCQPGRVDNMARDAAGRIARGISVYIVKRGA